jgi:acetate kinase
MGFTPLEGLVMGTRCGSIDPALVPYIMEREKLGTKEIDSIMNKNSGMLGLTETSNDMREIEQEAAHGSERHQLALEIYCHSVKKTLGAYMAELGRVDAVIFTGGIGENSRLVRRLSTAGLEGYGIVLDDGKNESNERIISSGRVKIMVVPTNEELAIARDTRRILSALKPAAVEAEPLPAAGPGALAPDDLAELLLIWAKNRRAGAAVLARKWARQTGRTIAEADVARELDRLGLPAASARKAS